MIQVQREVRYCSGGPVTRHRSDDRPAIGDRNVAIAGDHFRMGGSHERLAQPLADPVTDDKTESGGLALGVRKDLPDNLLFLFNKHPRETWAEDSGLAGAGETWLSNHKFFRAMTMKIYEDLTSLRDEAETTHDTGPSFHRHTRSLISGLDSHHRVEDGHYFPTFKKAEPRLTQGFEILEADHLMIHDAIIEFDTTARNFLRRIGQSEGPMGSHARVATDKAIDDLKRFGGLLRQHLTDEEDLVIPLILERARADPDFG